MNDSTLKELWQQVAEKKSCEAKQKELTAQRDTLADRLKKLEKSKLAEQADVDRLEGHSLAAFFYQVIGKMDEKLDKERQEAYAARVKYDAALHDLSSVDADLAQIQNRLARLSDCERQYQAALSEKIKSIKASAHPAAQLVAESESRIAALKVQKRELLEAINAGKTALHTVNEVLETLDNAISLEHQESFCSEGGRPFIHVLKGSKGGKPRKILMKTVDQHDAFEQLSSFCTERGIELFRNPNLSVQEALRLQRKQLVEELGLSKEVFEGSAYSMRHSFASRMMDGYNPNGERSSLEVSEDLGHHRTEVTAVYVGNMERAGEDTIPGLLTALVSNPMHSSTEDRLKMFFRELLVSHTFLGFSLLFWCAYTHNEGRDLEALAARKQAILGKKRNLYTQEVLMEKLSSISTKSTAEQFLIQFNQCCPADWIEKNVMAPFDANLFFK